LSYLGRLKIEIRKKFKKKKKPKVSVISPLHNRERFLKTFLNCIQHQNFDNIEIIFVDDKSTDNGVNLLEKYQEKDERIKIIKNKRNKGTLIARNIGVLYSQAKYLILPDPDDIISKDIINTCLYYAEKYKFEIVRFYAYSGNKKQDIKFATEVESKPVYQPELQTYLFYANKKLRQVDYGIKNKMIKKKLFIKALNLLNNFYLNIYMTWLEDQLMNFVLYKTAKSFYKLNKFGYYYIRNNVSICNNIIKFSHMRRKFYFIYLKLVFEYSKNTKYEKDMANYLFSRILKRRNNIEKELSYSFLNGDFNLYYDIINKFLNCKFTSEENYLILLKLKNKIQKKINFFKFYRNGSSLNNNIK
jgi:glycosyltransferase involved in cell wall biosynthesis